MDAAFPEVDSGPACASAPTYAEVRDTVFVTRCSFGRCHGGTEPGPPGPPRPTGTLPLSSQTTRDTLLTAMSDYGHDHVIVRPGDPYGSFLWQKLTNDLPEDGSLGEPMPLGEAIQWRLIPEDELELVRCWIKTGAR